MEMNYLLPDRIFIENFCVSGLWQEEPQGEDQQKKDKWNKNKSFK